jgi:anti-sigma-K factor RskA
MSTSIRYQNPRLCDHLASQYVAGDMTARVRARTETLAQSIPALSDAIGQWADDMIPLQEAIYEVSNKNVDESTKRISVWPLIDQRITRLTESMKTPLVTNKGLQNQLWNTLLLWRMMAGVTTLASVVLVGFLWLTSPSQHSVIAGPSYLAAMSVHGDANQSPQFVISVYAKSIQSPSTLHVQWVKEQKSISNLRLHLWAENEETGAVEYIGLQDLETGAIQLTKPLWMSIANSKRLFMTKNKQQPSDNNIVFSGLCLQLQEWQS